jgi:hypothetical protein
MSSCLDYRVYYTYRMIKVLQSLETLAGLDLLLLGTADLDPSVGRFAEIQPVRYASKC